MTILHRAARLLPGALAIAFLAIAAVAPAQSIEGRISGIARDSSDAVVPGATVTITNGSTGISWVAVSDSEGFYIATHVPIGSYSLRRSSPASDPSSNRATQWSRMVA